MTAIRVSPSASVIETEIGVVVRTDLGTFQLEGSDVKVFLQRMLPLLDGTRDREAIVSALGDYSAESVTALVDVLTQYGLVEAADADRDSGETDFFGKWLSSPAVAADRLQSAEVVVVGVEPWAERAVEQLIGARVGRLAIVDGDDEAPKRQDLSRISALVTGAGDAKVEVHDASELDALAAELSGDALLLATAGRDRVGLLRRVAVIGEQHNLRSLFAHLDGFDAVLGPLVVPGDSACWECYRLRRLANADNPPAALAIEAELLRAPPPPRRRSYLAPMSALLGDLVALEAVKVLTEYVPSELVGRTLVQNLISYQTSLHGLVPMPWCPVCGGAARRPRPREGGPGSSSSLDVDDPAELRDRLAGWVDERTGPIRLLTLATAAAPEPEVPATASAYLAPYTDGHRLDHPEIASGKGLTKIDALRSAVGEAIERYSAARYRREELTRADAMSLKRSYVDPRDLCLYDDDQYARPDFPYSRYEATQPIDWAEAHWFDTGEDVLVPALLTYLNFESDHGAHFCQVTSNGLAAGATLEDASVRALLELVERDALMLTWLAHRPGRPLSVNGQLPSQVTEALRQLKPLGVETKLALLDVGISIPVVACLGFGDGESWPGVTLALAADTNPLVAATKAILEHGHVGPYIRREMRDQTHPVPAKAEAVRSLLDHALFYSRPERADAARFLLEGDPISLGDLPRIDGDRGDLCRRALAAAGVRVAIADVTAPDVAGSPFRVARALGVHMQPIYFGYGLERRANPRLRALAAELNEMPHPLA